MRADLLDDPVHHGIRDRNRKIVLRDLPFTAQQNQDARSAAHTQIGRIQHLVEPGGFAIGGKIDVPAARA